MRVAFLGWGPMLMGAMEVVKSAGDEIVGVVLPNYPEENLKTTREVIGGLECSQEDLFSKDLDFIIICGYNKIIKKDLIDLPKNACLNLHPSLLPKYRGANVLNWQIANGETESGVTLHYVDEGADSGDIIAQKKFTIESKEVYADVDLKAAKIGSELLKEQWPRIKEGTNSRTPQDSSKATHFHRRKPEDSEIDPEMGADEALNLIRACDNNNYPAFVKEDGKTRLIRINSFGMQNHDN